MGDERQVPIEALYFLASAVTMAALTVDKQEQAEAAWRIVQTGRPLGDPVHMEADHQLVRCGRGWAGVEQEMLRPMGRLTYTGRTIGLLDLVVAARLAFNVFGGEATTILGFVIDLAASGVPDITYADDVRDAVQVAEGLGAL